LPASTVLRTPHEPDQRKTAAMRYNDRSPVRKRSLRTPPASRADHAARCMLGNIALWTTLSSEDHSVLCELPAPHGPLFAWLEQQLHENGPMPWEALSMQLQGRPDEEWARQLVSDSALAADPAEDAASELRDLLNRMLIERIKEQETRAIEDSKQDPQALQRYRELLARRMQLEKIQSSAIITG